MQTQSISTFFQRIHADFLKPLAVSKASGTTPNAGFNAIASETPEYRVTISAAGVRLAYAEPEEKSSEPDLGKYMLEAFKNFTPPENQLTKKGFSVRI